MRRWSPLLLALCLVVPAVAQKPPAKLRGYTVMAGGLGREPRGPDDAWSNTVERHLAFVDRARIDLVAIELPYGLSERFPKSPAVARFIRELRARDVKVWILYPHVLAQTFDLPRQVGADGDVVDWNCCFNAARVQDWLVDNGRALVDAYRPDALILFGTFHVGGACRCESCEDSKERDRKVMERFFVRLRDAVREVEPETQLGTCDFWAVPTKATLTAVDLVCPVVPIFEPGHAGKGQVRAKVGPLRSRHREERIVPYVKLFLASQTASDTDDVLAAVRESCARADGFLLWGYNPGHACTGQDYDHDAIAAAIAELAPARKR